MADKRPPSTKPSIIEQAAKRLAELQRAGIQVPDAAAPAAQADDLPQGFPPSFPRDPAHDSPLLRSPAADAKVAALSPRAAPAAAASAAHGPRVEIDLGRLQAMGYLAPNAPRSQLADEYRVVKRPLLARVAARPEAGGPPANLIMITSAVAGEGKTFSAINLALSIASEMDRTVLLVDADVQRSAVLDRLGLPSSKGLLDVLTDASVSVQDVILRTNIEKLSILPAGTPQSHATELLASDAMARLLDELASRYDDRVLIFDAPPLLPSTESRVLASHMGQVVLVVAADRTPQASVVAALDTVDACPIVMTLLNKTRYSRSGSYYGYYGGYGYGYGS